MPAPIPNEAEAVPADDDGPSYVARRKIYPQSVHGTYRRIKWILLLITLGIYYALPFVLALSAWETAVSRRPPVLALASAVAVWAGWRWLPGFASADAQAAFFIAWTVPLAIGLARTLYLPGGLPFRHRQGLGQRREPLTAVVANNR